MTDRVLQDLLAQVVNDLAKKPNDTWGCGFGYQPGKVVLVVAFRKDGKIIGSDLSFEAKEGVSDQVDAFIEQIRLTKVEALRKRQ